MYTLRQFRGADDLPGMVALRNARIRRDGYGEFATLASITEQYTHLQRCDQDTDVVIAERDGEVVGYARTTWDDTADGVRDHWLILEADPVYPGLEDALLTWCEERALVVAATMPGACRLVAEALEGSDRRERLVARGFAALRYSVMMIRPHLRDVPDRPLPDGVEIRPVTDEMLRAIWEADVEAFRDHRGYVEQTEEDWAMFREDADAVGTALWHVAWAGDGVVGQVRTYANEGDREMFGVRRAWTESISTHRAWRKRGIASAVICASLRQLDELGYEEAALGVDTENPNGAYALYESLGYAVVVATETLYHRPI